MKIMLRQWLEQRVSRTRQCIRLSASVAIAVFGQGAGPSASSRINRGDKGGSQGRRVALSCIAALALAGCATRPLVVSCVTKEQLAELKAAEPPKIREKLTGRADEDVRLIAGSNLRLRSWSETLLGVITVCAG